MNNEIIRAKVPAKNINIAFVLCVCTVWLLLTIWTSAFFSPDSEYDLCIEAYEIEVSSVHKSNMEQQKYCINTFKDTPYELRDCMQVLTPMPVNSCVNKGTWVVSQPDTKINKITLRDKFWLSDCRFINDSHRLGKYNLEWMAYDIACEVGKSFDVKSPWDFQIEEIGYWANLGNYIILRWVDTTNWFFTDTRIVLGHTVTTNEVDDLFSKWQIIWQTNVSWASTWNHVHIELWNWFTNVSREYALWEKYKSINWTKLLNHRGWDFWQQKKDVFYFTHYDLWDKNQNDSTPCIGASGKDLCKLESSGLRTMALTSDIRESLGIKFWDKVRLLWDEGCEGIFQVEDEMNKRYRQTPWVLRPWTPYYIKGDLPSMDGWVCSVTKI